MTPELLFYIGSLAVSLANAFAIVYGALRVERRMAETVAKVEEVHKATNGLTDRLIVSTASASLAEGIAQGRAERNPP